VLNCPANTCCLSTWARSCWRVFEEFDNVTYVQSNPYSLKIVDNRRSPGTIHMPLHFFPKHVLEKVLSFSSISDLARLSVLSHKWNKLASSNKFWQNLYFDLKQGPVGGKDIDPLPTTCRPCWPLAPPQKNYYKLVCMLWVTVSGSKKSYPSCFSCHQMVDRKKTFCKDCQRLGRMTSAVALARYGLEEVDLRRSWISWTRPPLRLQKRRRIRKVYSEVEIRLLAILKWGKLGAFRKRRGDWEGCFDDGLLKKSPRLQPSSPRRIIDDL